MRRSLEDAMNKVFEETTMKNVPIGQFWSFKRRNGAQNWNLHEKLSKIGEGLMCTDLIGEWFDLLERSET